MPNSRSYYILNDVINRTANQFRRFCIAISAELLYKIGEIVARKDTKFGQVKI